MQIRSAKPKLQSTRGGEHCGPVLVKVRHGAHDDSPMPIRARGAGVTSFLFLCYRLQDSKLGGAMPDEEWHYGRHVITETAMLISLICVIQTFSGLSSRCHEKQFCD
jgi:hypothetical protein